jgi:hypothetical protein
MIIPQFLATMSQTNVKGENFMVENGTPNDISGLLAMTLQAVFEVLPLKTNHAIAVSMRNTTSSTIIAATDTTVSLFMAILLFSLLIQVLPILWY